MTTFYSFQKKINKSIEDSTIGKELRDDFLLISLYFAQLAYFSPSYIQTQLDNMGALTTSIYNKGGVQAIFSEFDTFAVISFKGREADKWKEIKTDFQCWKSPFCGFNVHYGFANTLSNVSKRLLIDIEEMAPNKRILYTGHSLGGALAILMAILKPPTEVCTFGSPRAVNASEVAEHLKDVKITRVYAKNDFVSVLPPEFIGYRHLGDSLCLDGLPSKWHSHKLRTYLAGVVGNYITVDGDSHTMVERLRDFLYKTPDDNDNEMQV